MAAGSHGAGARRRDEQRSSSSATAAMLATGAVRWELAVQAQCLAEFAPCSQQNCCAPHRCWRQSAFYGQRRGLPARRRLGVPPLAADCAARRPVWRLAGVDAALAQDAGRVAQRRFPRAVRRAAGHGHAASQRHLPLGDARRPPRPPARHRRREAAHAARHRRLRVGRLGVEAQRLQADARRGVRLRPAAAVRLVGLPAGGSADRQPVAARHARAARRRRRRVAVLCAVQLERRSHVVSQRAARAHAVAAQPRHAARAREPDVLGLRRGGGRWRTPTRSRPCSAARRRRGGCALTRATARGADRWMADDKRIGQQCCTRLGGTAPARSSTS